MQMAKEMWDKLELTYEGTKDVRRAIIVALSKDFGLFHQQEGEPILETFNRFGKIMNDLDALGKHYSEEEMVEKIVMSLTAPWQSKVTAITKNPIFVTLTLDQLRGNPMSYESTFLKEQMETKRKQSEVALKVDENNPLTEDKRQEDHLDDKEMALLTRRMYTYYKKREQNRIGQKESSSRYGHPKDSIICYECQKPGHIKIECPQLKRRINKNAMVGTWSDDELLEDSDDDLEIANMRLVAKEEDNTENEKPEVNDSPFIYDELLNAFDRVLEDSKILMFKYNELRNAHRKVLRSFNVIVNENNILEEKVNQFENDSYLPSLLDENKSLKEKVN